MYLKMYVRFRKFLHLLASYDYLESKNMNHGMIIDDLMLNIDDAIKQLEDSYCFTEKDKIIEYFRYMIKRIKEF